MPAHPLVLVPGLLCDEAVWAAPARGAEPGWPTSRSPATGSSTASGAMAEAILARAPPRFALAGHSMGGRVALEVYARAPERVTRLALLDTGYEGLPGGDVGERERDGRLRLLQIARHDGMRAMGTDWARGMVHPRRLADTRHSWTPSGHDRARRRLRCSRPRSAPCWHGPTARALLRTDHRTDAGALRPRGQLEPDRPPPRHRRPHSRQRARGCAGLRPHVHPGADPMSSARRWSPGCR